MENDTCGDAERLEAWLGGESKAAPPYGKVGVCKSCWQYREVDDIRGTCQRCESTRRRMLRGGEIVDNRGDALLDISDYDGTLIPMRNERILTHEEWYSLVREINLFYENESPKTICEANRKASAGERVDRISSDRRGEFRYPPIEGYIYLLRSENNYYKLGRTVSMKTRMASYKRQYPIVIDVVRCYRCSDYKAEETALLTRFAEYRLGQTEWFSFPPNVLDAVMLHFAEREA